MHASAVSQIIVLHTGKIELSKLPTPGTRLSVRSYRGRCLFNLFEKYTGIEMEGKMFSLLVRILSNNKHLANIFRGDMKRRLLEYFIVVSMKCSVLSMLLCCCFRDDK